MEPGLFINSEVYQTWIPAFAGMTLRPHRISGVIPAKAGIHLPDKHLPLNRIFELCQDKIHE
jgi:hypothetical protein